MAAKPLVIIGAGETAELAFEYFSHDSPYEVAGFSVDRDYLKQAALHGLPVVPFEEIAAAFPPDRFDAFVAISDTQLNRVRRRKFDASRALGYRLASYVSSRAFVWRNVAIGENCFVLEHNTLQPFVTVGDNVVLWSGNHIGHRTVIEDDVFIASHVVISGFCRIGASSFLGVNVSVADGVSVAPDNFIAMGAAVTANTEPDRIYQGLPARPRDVSARRFCRVRD